MTPAEEIASVVPDQDLSDALKRLMSQDVRQVPVVEDGHLIGMLRRRDIVRWLQIHSELYGPSQAK
jgi:CBS domain-containing protein